MTASSELLVQQQRLVDRYEEASAFLRRFPGVVGVGVGARERRGELVPELAFRVYVAEKIDEALLPPSYRVPRRVFSLPTDVILSPDIEAVSSSSSAPFVPNRDTTKYRPLQGGSQLRNEKFQDDDTRGMGTIGCLATTTGGVVVALTCQHVTCAATELNVPAGSSSSFAAPSGSSGATSFACNGVKVGQPRHVICCCCCTFNEIGSVLKSQKDAQVDCALVTLDSDTKDGVVNGGTINQVVDIGAIAGVAQAVCFSEVRKRGASTRLTRGTVVDVLYEGSQILINPLPGFPKFAFFGDSGAVIVNSDSKVVGLLWGADRGTRNRGVANHIGPVLAAMGITIAGDAGTGLGIPTTSCGGSSSSGAIELPSSSSSSAAALSSSSSSSAITSSSSSFDSSSSDSSSSSSSSSSNSSSSNSSSSSSSCAPNITNGPRWYSGVTKDVPLLLGCKATIDTFAMNLPCEPNATFEAFSTVWTGVTKADISKWGQIGITRRRNAGGAAVTPYLKYEVMAGAAAADYHLEFGPGYPAIGTTQEYECVVDPATGRWEFFVAGVSKFTFTRPGWVNETGDRVDFNAEIYDLGSQMPGIVTNKCHITGCQYKTGTPTSSSSSSAMQAGAYIGAGLTAANRVLTDATQHGFDFVSATAIDIWDINP